MRGWSPSCGVASEGIEATAAKRPATLGARLPEPALLQTIELYYDALPRDGAHVEQIGPFTLFAQQAGKPSYARPSLGAAEFSVDDVEQVRARQRALGRPEAFEWVAETTPALSAMLQAAGLKVEEHPLMVLVGAPIQTRVEAEVRLANDADDPARSSAVAQVAFDAPGTARGAAGVAEATARALQLGRRPRNPRAVVALALVDGHAVGVASHQPLAGTTEIVGVGVLPAFRRRGLGAALTSSLAQHALARGVTTVFLSAGDASIARVYARVGFQHVATACTAEPPLTRR